MLILLTILATIIIAYGVIRLAWRYHVAQLRLERQARNANLTAAKLLADQIESALFARDYYRAALLEITRQAPGTTAAMIAERSLGIDQDPIRGGEGV